jgi:signal transduction histidine kinase
MVSRRGPSPIALSLGLVVAGIVAALAWQQGTWGLGVGAALVALWLAALNWWLVARPRDAVRPDPARTDDADGLVLRLLLDAAPTPLLAIDATTARALNRAARRLFATDDRILPVPPPLTDATATHLRHEGRGWRIDRVRVANGQDVAALIDIEQEERAAEARASAEMIQVLGHELLNGLAPIASLAESGAVAVARPEVDVALLREILDTLARRAEGLQRFTEAYRAIARLPEPTRRAVPVGNWRTISRDSSPRVGPPSHCRWRRMPTPGRSIATRSYRRSGRCYRTPPKPPPPRTPPGRRWRCASRQATRWLSR